MSLPLDQILLGDAIDTLKTLLNSSIDACITSPVYFQSCDYQVLGQYGLEPTIEAYLSQQVAVFAEVHRVLKEGSICWVVIGDVMNNYSPIRAKGQRRKSGEYLHRRPKQAGYLEKEVLSIPFQFADALRSWGWMHRQTFIWDKGSCGTLANSDTGPCQHEFVLQMGKWSKRSRPYLNCKPIKSSVLSFPPTSDPVHPCPFPIALASQLIEASTEVGNTVLDPFMGSGTTAQAAQALDRHFIGIELNPKFREDALIKLGRAEVAC